MKYLKGLFAIALIAGFASAAQAQTHIVKMYPTGFHLNTAGEYGNNIGYLLKWGYEYVFTDRITGQMNIGVLFNRYHFDYGGFFGEITVGDNVFVMEPQVKAYLLDVAPHGLYVGGYYFVAVGFAGGGAMMGLGPNVGYQHFFLDDRLAVDGNIGVGVGLLVGNGDASAGFEMPFQVGAGWAF